MPDTSSSSTMAVGDAAFEGLGWKRLASAPEGYYKDSSTVIVVPTRGIERHTKDERCGRGDHDACFIPAVPLRVVQSWQNLIAPMNQKRAFLYAVGREVGKAYDAMVAGILADPNLSKWKYIMTLEDDNLVPPDAHIRLLESIEAGPFDAVSALYFTKGPINMPMAYGDPAKYRAGGELEFRPRDLGPHIARGENVIEVNGIAMGCALWRMDLFRAMPQPWFVTVNDVVPGKGAAAWTQDLFFCKHARQCGKRLATDLRVRCGHLDVESGIVY
jgi:hypothetical protein